MDLTKALREVMTPQWLKDIDTTDIIGWELGDCVEMIGTLLGLMDYCRLHMPTEDWNYVHTQIIAKWKRHTT